MKRVGCVAVVMLFVACTQVHPADLAAWRGVPVIEIERHPFFSTLPHERSSLSDGTELWTYDNCGKTNVNCTSYKAGYAGVQTTCSGGDNSCCHHQFFVRDGVVQELRVIGHCRTGCDKRPRGVCETIIE